MERVLFFEAGGQRFGLPLRDVREVLRAAAPSPLPGMPPGWVGLMNVRGTLVPVCALGARLGLPARPAGPDDNVVLSTAGGRPVALWVDRVTSVGDVAIEEPPTPPNEDLPPAARAVARTADGLVVILDLAAFLAADEWSAVEATLERQEAGVG